MDISKAYFFLNTNSETLSCTFSSHCFELWVRNGMLECLQLSGMPAGMLAAFESARFL